MNPVVTAIIPTFRRPALLERSVGSVLAQDYRPLELIVVDDSSGDSTPEMLAGFATLAQAAGVEYRWCTVPNGGPGPARNHAMKLAQGDYFAFLDDDDAWLPGKITRQVAAMQAEPDAGASFTRFVHVGKEDRPKPSAESMQDGWVFESLCTGSTRAHIQTLMISRAAFVATGGFGALRQWEDTEFELRLALLAPFVAVPDVLTVITPAPDSISREAGLEGDLRRDREKLDFLAQFVAAHGRHPRFSMMAAQTLRARIYDEHIKHLLWLGRVREARAAHEQAMSECGPHPLLQRLRRKLLRARVAGWFGLRVRRPGN